MQNEMQDEEAVERIRRAYGPHTGHEPTLGDLLRFVFTVLPRLYIMKLRGRLYI